MNNKKFLIILVVLLVFFRLLERTLVSLDKNYGDTIPKINYSQNHQFTKEIYKNNINSTNVSIYASYPENFKTYILDFPTLHIIENGIIDNWKPYLKKDNEVIISLKINKNGAKEYTFLGNTGPYAAANAAREAVLSPKFIGNNILLKDGTIDLVYKFKVSKQ